MGAVLPDPVPSRDRIVSFLPPQLKLILFSGKGGVGKTTLSCALSRQLARDNPQQRYLLMSTDPAHSLGDVLQIPLGDEAAPLEDLPNLSVRALDAAARLVDFKATYQPALELIAERSSWLEREDWLPLWDLTWPGVDELMAILEIDHLLSTGTFDTILLDTAPTGHTLRLLELPDFLEQLLDVFRTFQTKYRELGRILTGTTPTDIADQFLEQLDRDLQAGQQRLTDPASTALWLVLLPEAMSVAETLRFQEALLAEKIPIGGVLVNQVVRGTESPWHQLRQSRQQELLVQLQQDLAPSPLWISPWSETDILGFAPLDQLSHQIQPFATPPAGDDLNLGSMSGSGLSVPSFSESRLPDFLATGIRWVLVGGKGGVGKTTVAGAIAWMSAQAHPDQSVGVVSIDPAHSLGDLFQMPLGSHPTPIAGNLWGQEMNAEETLALFRQDYIEDLVALMTGDLDGMSLQYDPQAWQQLLHLTPPGLDEVMALLAVMERLQSGSVGLLVLDMAPTGHLLRFLEMPEALEGWVSLALKLWLKYRDRVGRPELAQRLRGLLHDVRRLREQLQNPSFTSFVPVLNPQAGVVAETERLLQALDQLHIPHPYAVINRSKSVSPPALAALEMQYPQQTWIRVPFLPDPTPQNLAAYWCDRSPSPS